MTRDSSCHLGDKSIACQAPVVRGAVSGLVQIRSAAVTVAPRLPCLTVVLMLLFVFLCLTSGSCWSSGLPSALLSVANMTASSLLTLDNRKANFALCSLNRSLDFIETATARQCLKASLSLLQWSLHPLRFPRFPGDRNAQSQPSCHNLQPVAAQRHLAATYL